ncbi:alpha-amylase family protein [Carboxylicivirga sp. M1479]|uniref:alpha-amylase family protein n=1 Tax=Carboxylicivirga sp. M1479 TaxID=2594476 RepID=UPI002103082D|nr:alpha-amylase family protein [Carboxylicivirga sp. M1479]
MYKGIFITLLMMLLLVACQQSTNKQEVVEAEKKAVVYQVFTRLFGNTNTNNQPWGTIEQNGVGKFNDFNDKALNELKELGVTHMWYTGVPHHAVINDYTAFGISNDDPDVVKGRAGSPYAVKDYYNVNPDLALDPAKRLEEFLALVERTHKHGMKVLIDIVPNHVARHYEGKNNPEGVSDFGANDDTSVEYAINNNFYYIPKQSFKVPNAENNYHPLGGEEHPLANGTFDENPAKWTGNGSRLAQPHFHDWYETVKINYGVRPDGTKDFPSLPEGYDQMDYKAHYKFWKDKTLPDSWIKFRDIVIYWTKLGVDGFRFDMAEMVPVEFWSYLNSSIKTENPDAFLLAEVYNPSLYRDYILKGKMDYLYDKVELYDTLKHIMQGHGLTDNLPAIQEGLKDIEHNMLHFLENHDEQRIASPEFVGDAKKGMPAMVVSACISTAPTMLYFGQEVGEPGNENAGFGTHSRTSIFDYIGVPHHQRWVNNGLFDGGQLTNSEKELRNFYKRLLNFTINSTALMGEYSEIHTFNRSNTEGYGDKAFSFVRWSQSEQLIITTNFNAEDTHAYQLKIPSNIIKKWQLKDGEYNLTDQLYSTTNTLIVKDCIGHVKISHQPLQSFIYKLSN